MDIPRDPVPMEYWGKDHWSTFAYIETRIVDHKGRPCSHHMRNDPDRHPAFGNAYDKMDIPTREKYPTRLSIWNGDKCEFHELKDHDDWDCIEDAEKIGLLENKGTGINPVYRLTEYGKQVAAELRQWKQDGGNFATFRSKVVFKKEN